MWAIVTQSDEPVEREVVYRWENRGSRLRGDLVHCSWMGEEEALCQRQQVA